MVVEQLLTGSRWEILQALATRPLSTSELAARLHTSSANVSQQLKQLEIAGIVKRTRAQGRRVHYEYAIVSNALHYAYVGPRAVTKKSFSHDPYHIFIAALTTTPHALPLLTVLLSHPDLTKRFLAIGVLKREQPELFVLAEHVDDIRQQHANISAVTHIGEHKVVLWSHTIREVTEGITRKDQYFLESLTHIELSYDPEQSLLKLIQLQQEQHS